jgi:N-acetylmuramate 1-kinase
MIEGLPPRARVALEGLVTKALGAGDHSCIEMPGGASTRRYFRITARGPGEPRAIAMYAPDGARPEEVTAGGVATRWPFVEVQELLASRGVRVPRLLGDASDDGVLLLEDLGDDTLAAVLARTPERRVSLYRRAVVDLASMHRALVTLPDGSIVASRAFDETLLRWELAHFVEWGLDARAVTRSPAARRALDEAFDDVARELAARPRGFVHRDYQSRNLMLDPGGPARGDADALVVIDFQDALLGPRAYDLVALLRDSYQDLDEDFVATMIATYADAAGLDEANRAALRDEFDRLTVQRKLKDAGRFVFIEHKKGDPSFLPYIAPSLLRVRRALERLSSVPTFRTIRELLAEALPDGFG